ncbi:MAG: CvpA family protein [Candidatus Kuenenia sp.]|nr:CvpA family protein [Candidatus Kuenenia hertensis]
MIWIDYSIFVILFFAILFGFISGPVMQFLRIGCLLLSFFAAFFFHGVISNILKGILAQSITDLLSYFTIFGVLFIITSLITNVLKIVIHKTGISIGSRFFGGFLGIFKGVLFCGVIIFGVLLFCSKPTCDTVNTSKIAAPIGKGMQKLVAVIPESIVNKVHTYSDKINELKPQKRKEEKQKKEETPPK